MFGLFTISPEIVSIFDEVIAGLVVALIGKFVHDSKKNKQVSSFLDQIPIDNEKLAQLAEEKAVPFVLKIMKGVLKNV